MKQNGFAIAAFAAVLFVSVRPDASFAEPVIWSDDERANLALLSVDQLPPLPPDPSNAFADDPRAAAFGHRLFFDNRLSIDGSVSCATCHQPELAFTDGLKLSNGIGTTKRNSMTVIGSAYSPWLFWDGRKDSQWAQALGPLEDAAEHGGTRMQYARLVASDAAYRSAYEALFGAMPTMSDGARFPAAASPDGDAAARRAWTTMAPEDRVAISRVYANLGKAIAAYERRLTPGPGRFDLYVREIVQQGRSEKLSADEIAGLRLFLGAGRCTRCHNGPLLTNFFFHNTGVPDPTGDWSDLGRAAGTHKVAADAFNCLSRYSDALPRRCTALRFMKTEDPFFERGFKVPTLRDVSKTAPYMHAGQFATLAEVLQHYNQAPRQPVGKTELEPLGLSSAELRQIEAFLRALDSPSMADPVFLAPPSP